MNDPNGHKSHHVSEETLHGLACLLTKDAALAAFKPATLNDDLWQQAQVDPIGYF